MDRRRKKFLLLTTGIVATMAVMLAVGISQPGGMVYYLTVSEFLDGGAELDEGYRINGTVAAGTIERLASGEDVRFQVTDGTQSLPVTYHGIIPDTFVDEADVVIEGTLQGDGTFDAHTLLAKCPSKYEAAEGAEDADGYDHPEDVPRS